MIPWLTGIGFGIILGNLLWYKRKRRWANKTVAVISSFLGLGFLIIGIIL